MIPQYTNSACMTFMFVVVPKALDYTVVDDSLQWVIPHLIWSGNPPEPDHDEWEEGEIKLPAGHRYNLIALQSTITDEQAGMVVDSTDKENRYAMLTPKIRLASVLLSLQLPTDQDIAIVEVIKQNL